MLFTRLLSLKEKEFNFEIEVGNDILRNISFYLNYFRHKEIHSGSEHKYVMPLATTDSDLGFISSLIGYIESIISCFEIRLSKVQINLSSYNKNAGHVRLKIVAEIKESSRILEADIEIGCSFWFTVKRKD